jgi:arabinose-5-phosphate isomerase
MTRHPVTINSGTLAVEALRLMEQRTITSVVVVGHDHTALGVVHLHDLWRTQMV